ncbi:MAG: hypothetical protein JRJ44_05620 [Deltaproteobacteria bacterium]|nr:hypothetical protein [Deltaproteobacteria bacterium]
MKEEKQNIVEAELTDNDLEALDDSMLRDISGGKSLAYAMKYGIIAMYGIFPILTEIKTATVYK